MWKIQLFSLEEEV